MPLRDHFRPPLSDRRSWEGFHGGWPMMIVDALGRSLPPRYVAEPQVHLGASIEVDVATYEDDEAPARAPGGPEDAGPATATWAPPRPTFSIATVVADPAEYAVRVYDERRGRRLVAAVELVSPANKDRPEHRRAFVAKCAALLQERVCVAIVDVVTARPGNLYAELIEFLDGVDPSLGPSAPPLYAVACRSAGDPAPPRLDAWAHALGVGRALPTLPLWLAPGLAVPLDLEASYEATCRVLRIP